MQDSRLSFSVPSQSVSTPCCAPERSDAIRGELRGTADASRENANSHVILLGSWVLKKVSPPGESSSELDAAMISKSRRPTDRFAIIQQAWLVGLPQTDPLHTFGSVNSFV